jgi:hypothetical protein
MVLVLPLVRGTAEEQARESVGVFLAALADGDTATAHELLCRQEAARLAEREVAPAYVLGEAGRVAGAREVGATVQVRIAWDDGTATTVEVVNEEGARVCGVSGA